MQQKVFRIERMLAPRARETQKRTEAPVTQPAHQTQALRQELDAAQRILQGARRELMAASTPRLDRAVAELTAVVGDTAKATDKVLHNVEQIDEAAKTLEAALKNENNRSLAHDIQERVTAIYEACNFQDLIGQRISNSVAALRAAEAQMARVMAALDNSAAAPATPERRNALLNGPRLEGDNGHASQADVDRMFG